jgi:DNA-binding ferritin-like protein
MSMKRWSFVEDRAAAGNQAEVVAALQWLLACLRAQYWSYQQSHWQARGESAYGDHLLFQRLYESVEDHSDTLAEKMVGLYGNDAVSTLGLAPKFDSWVSRWSAVQCPHERGLLSEDDFQQVCRQSYEKLGDLGELTLGMDDFLMATANDHETNQYLLRQVLLQKRASVAWTELAKDLRE